MEANETTETIAVGKKNSPLEVSSRIISGIFTPFMIPFVAFFLLFFFTYLRIMPIQYKLIVLGIVYCFTILMPMLAIYLFKEMLELDDDVYMGKYEKVIYDMKSR